MIKIQNGTKRFKELVVFDDIDLEIHQCGIHVIQGESGSGKSTLLNILAGFDWLDAGEYQKEGVIATIFQNYELIDEITVKENIYLPMRVFQNHQVKEEAFILEMLGLHDLMKHYPRELSGGQKQRVGIARALFQNPSLILCDEPTESLDIENKNKVMDLLKRVSVYCPVILATHDQRVVDEYADWIYKIKDKKIVISKWSDTDDVQVVNEVRKLNTKGIRKSLNRIMRKKNVLFSLLLAFLVAVQVTLFGIRQTIFPDMMALESLVKDRIYMSGTTAKEVEEKMGAIATPILDIPYYLYNDYIYKNKVVPSDVKEEYMIAGRVNEGLEVVVNQNLANRLGYDCVGKTVYLNYSIGRISEVLETKIVGIVMERDLSMPMMYYNSYQFNEYLKTLYDGEVSYFDLIAEEPTFCQMIRTYEMTGSFMKQLEKEGILGVSAPFYEETTMRLNQQQMYRIVFSTMEYILMAGIVLTIIIYLVKETNHYMKTCSIFAAMGVGITSVKINYVRSKMFWMSVIYVVVLLLQQVLFESVLMGERTIDWTYMIYFVCGVYLLYFVVLLLCLLKLKAKNISNLLKDGVDA